MAFMHAQRQDALWRAVAGLLCGSKLWLAGLGRALPGACSAKHAIKAVDRLLGNQLLYAELKGVYAAIVGVVLRHTWTPVVLVDITEIRAGICAFTAALACDGRSIGIYAIVRSKKYVKTRQCQRRFLRGLRDVLPATVRPVLVTDAGFESPWFDEVEMMGWDYLGRVRKRTKFLFRDEWRTAPELHQQATNRARNLGTIAFPRCHPKERRVVLSKRRITKGRRRLTTKGTPGRRKNDARCKKSAHEPWLLATSLRCNPTQVVAIYATRMQIEESYRDTKNHRWGWALDQTRSRTNERLEILLLIAALAALVQLAVGCAGECEGLQRQFQANTERKRRVLSFFVLGRFLLQARNAHLVTRRLILLGLDELCVRIRDVADLVS
jgi:hypothetical protein